MELATEADFEFFNMWGQDETAALADIATKTANASAIYTNYFDLQFVIAFSNIWTDSNDPYSNAINGGRWTELREYWQDNFNCVHRDLVHMFTSINMACGYVNSNWMGWMCDEDPIYGLDARYTYSISEHPSPPAGNANRYKTMAHEIGHNLGADHPSCPTECGSTSTSGIMCEASCSSQLTDVFYQSPQCEIWNFICTLDCLGPPESQPCENCHISGTITSNNNMPIPDCGDKDIITYNVTICNSCDQQDLNVRAKFQPDLVDYRPDLPTDFPSVIGSNSNFLETIVNFTSDECKQFEFSVQLKPGIAPNTTVRTDLILEGREIDHTQFKVFGFNQVDGTNTPVSLDQLIQQQVGVEFGNAICDGNSSSSIHPAWLGNLEVSGQLNIDVDHCFEGYTLKMNPGASIVVEGGHKLSVGLSTHIFGCDQLWQGIIAEQSGHLNIDNSTIEDAAVAVQLKGSQKVSITNSHFNNNLTGLFVEDVNPGHSMKIILEALSGNTFSSDEDLLPAPANISSGPAPSFGAKPFAGVWIENSMGSTLHSLDNTFTGLSNGIYSRRINVKVTGNSFININENSYDPAISGFGIRSASGLIRGKHTGPRVFQEIGLGKEPGVYTFQNCSKGINIQGMVVDYIKDNAMRVGKGIEINGPSQKAVVKDNKIDVTGSIGIEISQPNPTVVAKIERNDIDIAANVTDGIGIQYNTMGLDPVGGGQAEINDNEIILNATGSFGLQTNATNSTTMSQNIVTVGDGAANSKAFQVNSDFNSLLNCNSANGSDIAGGTTGFDMSDAESTDYSCNSTTDMGIGVRFEMGSFSPEAFQETSFSGGDVGLIVEASSAIGEQTHTGNNWNGDFGSNFGAQHGSNLSIDWSLSRFFVNTTEGTGFHPFTPPGQSGANGWFVIQPNGLPNDNCGFTACAIAGPTPPNNEEKFNFDDIIADYTFTISNYSTEIGWLANRYLYRKLTRKPSLITPGTDYEAFYNNESTTPIGRFSNVRIATTAIHDIDQAHASQLGTDINNIIISMESIADIDSQLVSQGQDSVLMQQRLQEMQSIDINETDIDSIASLALVQQTLDADAVISQNNIIADSLLLETNKKVVNDIYLNTLAKGKIELDSLHIIDLSAVALQCPLAGGSAVYEARSLLSLVQDVVYNDGLLCSGVQGLKSHNETVSSNPEGFSLYPNPAKEQVRLVVPEQFLGGELVLSNPFGSIIRRKMIEEEDLSTSLQTGHLASGIYQIIVFEKGKKVFSDKLVIVH